MDEINLEKDLIKNLMSEISDLKNQIDGMQYDINAIKNKLSMPNGIAQIRNSKFFIPNYPMDWIQRWMVDNQNYWYLPDLEVIDKWLPERPVIIDVGANIGSYSIYWAMERYAKKIYAFEPFPATYAILLTNIKLNNLQNKIKPYNVGLSDKRTKLTVDNYFMANTGATSFKEDSDGKFVFKQLDSFKFRENIDVIKIDVEGNELEVLGGAVNIIKKCHPLIIIETFENKDKVDMLLSDLGYKVAEVIQKDSDYIYSYQA